MDTSGGQLSTADALLLRQFGLGTIMDVLGILLEGILFGAYSIFFLLAIYSFRQTGIRSLKAVLMSAAVGYLYLSSLAALAMDCYIAFANIHTHFMLESSPLDERWRAVEANGFQFVGAVELFWAFNAIVADAVVVWRTWAVYQGWLPAVGPPCFLLFAAFVFALIDVIFTLQDSVTGSIPSIPNAYKVYTVAQILVWALSLGTNILCTMLMGIRAWQFRKETIDLHLGVQRYPGMSTVDILSLLVESGFIYSFLWAIQIIGYLTFDEGTTGDIVSHVIVRIGRQITGMYPTLIIVLVNFQRTMWEGYGDAGSSITTGPIRWGSRRRRSKGSRQGEDEDEHKEVVSGLRDSAVPFVR
ncbi:hypothetical protein FB45DRAFT_939595 [Roridomyces roridus]|uniref:Uncharacterized protein n=1 Tax=Roridomyces roridus TaxID=1738132 RepID=A0AAD7B7X3_9AGAR|nr:hypothetical protein FB45DRAFT_939595 [Roridomyces roridus]